jgi:serine/threonine-protein kinase
LARGDNDEAFALIPASAPAEQSVQTGDTTVAMPQGKGGSSPRLGRNFWILSSIGATVAIALIATSLTVLFSAPRTDEAIEEPLLPVPTEIDQEVEPVVEEEEEDITPGLETVEITEAEIIGKTTAQVQEALTRKGLRLDSITSNIAPAQDKVGTAYRLNPQGVVAKNTLIAVYFYAPIPQPPKPRDMTLFPATGPYAPNSEILLEWPGYAQCPPGFPLQSYTLQIVGGTILDAAGPVLLPEQTAVTIRLGSSDSFRASYLVNCGNLTSPLSNEVSLTITPPAEPPVN